MGGGIPGGSARRRCVKWLVLTPSILVRLRGRARGPAASPDSGLHQGILQLDRKLLIGRRPPIRIPIPQRVLPHISEPVRLPNDLRRHRIRRHPPAQLGQVEPRAVVVALQRQVPRQAEGPHEPLLAVEQLLHGRGGVLGHLRLGPAVLADPPEGLVVDAAAELGEARPRRRGVLEDQARRAQMIPRDEPQRRVARRLGVVAVHLEVALGDPSAAEPVEGRRLDLALALGELQQAAEAPHVDPTAPELLVRRASTARVPGEAADLLEDPRPLHHGDRGQATCPAPVEPPERVRRHEAARRPRQPPEAHLHRAVPLRGRRVHHLERQVTPSVVAQRVAAQVRAAPAIDPGQGRVQGLVAVGHPGQRVGCARVEGLLVGLRGALRPPSASSGAPGASSAAPPGSPSAAPRALRSRCAGAWGFSGGVTSRRDKGGGVAPVAGSARIAGSGGWLGLLPRNLAVVPASTLAIDHGKVGRAASMPIALRVGALPKPPVARIPKQRAPSSDLRADSDELEGVRRELIYALTDRVALHASCADGPAADKLCFIGPKVRSRVTHLPTSLTVASGGTGPFGTTNSLAPPLVTPPPTNPGSERRIGLATPSTGAANSITVKLELSGIPSRRESSRASSPTMSSAAVTKTSTLSGGPSVGHGPSPGTTRASRAGISDEASGNSVEAPVPGRPRGPTSPSVNPATFFSPDASQRGALGCVATRASSPPATAGPAALTASASAAGIPAAASSAVPNASAAPSPCPLAYGSSSARSVLRSSIKLSPTRSR